MNVFRGWDVISLGNKVMVEDVVAATAVAAAVAAAVAG